MKQKPEPIKRSPEEIEKGAIYLKQADTLLKEANFSGAMEALANARNADPRNPYLSAYEERIQALNKAHKEKVQGYLSKAKQYISEERYEPALEMVSLAFEKNPSDAEIVHLKNEIKRAKQAKEESMRASISIKVASYVAVAEGMLAQGDYIGAIGELLEGFILDPLNESLLHFEERHLEEILKFQENRISGARSTPLTMAA